MAGKGRSGLRVALRETGSVFCLHALMHKPRHDAMVLLAGMHLAACCVNSGITYYGSIPCLPADALAPFIKGAQAWPGHWHPQWCCLSLHALPFC